MEREFCPKCAVKHLGQAHVLSKEIKKGYPEHYWIALAHMAEAEDELVSEFEEMADLVRVERKAWEDDPAYRVDFLGLILEVAMNTAIMPDLSSWGDPVWQSIGSKWGNHNPTKEEVA